MTEARHYEVAPRELRTEEPFSSLFPIQKATLEAITQSILDRGYDPGEPLAIWDGVVIDGHTRLAAAKRAKVRMIPCMYHDFKDEDEALRYALSRQRDRRNLTDADLLRVVAELDKRRSRAEVARENGTRGGRPETNAPCGALDNPEPIDPSPEPARSSTKTAKILGISERKVERIRTVLDRAEPEVKAAVASGEKSINAAYNETVRPIVPVSQEKGEANQEAPRPFRWSCSIADEVEAEDRETAIEIFLERLNDMSPAQMVRKTKALQAA